MTTIAMQTGIPGLAPDQVTGDLPARIAYLLAEHPEARDDYAALVYLYWLEFDGLGEVLPADNLPGFVHWLLHRATSWKTIQNRAGEVQNDIHALEAAPDIAARRMIQARQGRVR